MSDNNPVDPYEIPHFTGSWCELDLRVKALSGASTKIPTAAGDVHTTFGGLRAYYEAPEAEQLFAVTEPVKSTAQQIGSDLSVIAGALRTYAQDAQPLAKQLDELRAEAAAFRAKVADDDEWREDGDLIDENLERRNKVAEVWTAFQAAETACYDKIVALVGGPPLKTDDGSGKGGMYGYDAEALKQAKSLPWGDAVEESTPGWQVWEHAADFVTGFVVDGVWATVVGLGTLAGFNGWDAAGEAWSGLATLGEGLGFTIIFGIDSPYWTTPEDELPPRLRESRVAIKETGKALLAWDDWDAHPGRAAGAVTFNVVTTVFTGGAGGAASTAGKAGAAARALAVAGKVSRVVDPMTYVFKGAGAGLTKLGDVMVGLKDMGKIKVPPLPEGAITLPPGAYKLPDGTLHLPEGAAIPEGAFAVPKRSVLLAEGTPIPPGAVDLGDGMVQLPRRGEVPAGSVAVPEGTIKVPGGATALPPGTAPAGTGFFSPEGHLLARDGSLLQHADDAPKATTPANGADVSPTAPPVRQPALVGAGDDGLRLGDNAPGTFPDRTPGGGAGDNMPTNNLDNGVGGGTGRAGDNTPTGGAGGHADTPSTGSGGRDVPGGSAADNGTSGSGNAVTPGGSQFDPPSASSVHPSGLDDAARRADDATHRAEYEAAREKPAGERTPSERAAITREHIRLANEDPVWRSQHYDKWGPGKRNSAEEMVDGQLLPKLVEKPGGGWMAADDLPYANPERYDVNPMNRGRDTVTPDNLNHLDEVSANRVAGMDLAAADRAYKANPTHESAKMLADAQEHFNKTVGEGASNNSKLGEALGEEAARRHMLRQKEFEGAREITDLPDTPNGSKRFDQLWRDKDGNLIIVEAKGPNGTLEWRQGNGAQDSGTMVKQGTIEYIRTILADMDERAVTSPNDARYAKEIRAAIKDKTLRYVLVQAVENNGKYAGAELKHLKIF
ncbi:hypothetical protein [Streptomyces xantholiticus]|uniref:hypothetical protein n=1 Tax=Streptomyces xantholiticus TaxID=68285 RepID=UPI00167B0C8D|nr:hypothetical protein [Streptomyces xantholiticus]GGW42097.1 hypothetical protein GCM10010381_28850 [Streptomyces xantholiticus]